MIPKSVKIPVIVTREDDLYIVESNEFNMIIHGDSLELAITNFWTHLGYAYQHYVIDYSEKAFTSRALITRRRLIDTFGFLKETSDIKK